MGPAGSLMIEKAKGLAVQMESSSVTTLSTAQLKDETS